jgi:predicted metal-dependent hydrolase
VSKKSANIAQLVAAFRGRELDARYLAYFHCFNQQLFYEAHDALEELWLADRSGPNGAFYKGLIQLAGAFVHVQKNRSGPACALLRLARANLNKYPPSHHQLDLTAVCSLIEKWSSRLESAPEDAARLVIEMPPRLTLIEVNLDKG